MILDNFIQKKEQKPLLNYVYNQTNQPFLQEYYQIDRKRRMHYLVLRSPEATSIVDGHARDICGKFHFEPVNENSSGKIKVNRAKSFVEKTLYKKQRLAWIKDALNTGEGFMFISELSKQYTDKIAGEFRRIDPSFNDMSFRARNLNPIASTTVAINHNSYDVIGYTQTLLGTSGGQNYDKTLPKNKVMHLTFDTPAGKVEGYTPLFSVPLHLELLWLLWDNQYDFQVKGNHPDLIVMAEMLDRNKNAFNKVQSELSTYNQPGNSKHGTLLLTGDKFNIQQLERMDSLQFKEVGMFISSLVGSLFHYPQSRQSIKTEESAKAKDSTGGNEKFYYNIVEQKQDMMSDLENQMFWIPYFGVRIVQDKSYKHDQIEEGTAQQIRIGNLNTLTQMLNAQGKILKEQKLIDVYNGIDTTFSYGDMKDGELKSVAKSTMNNQLSNSDAMNQGMSRNDRTDKRNDEKVREISDGKPNGVSR